MKPNIKQVIVMRNDLNMRKGKMVAQGAHASIAVFFNRKREQPTPLPEIVDGARLLPSTLTVDLWTAAQHWVFGAFTKICVRADSEAELLEIHRQTEAAGLPCALIKDSGLTEFGGVSTFTCLAIGPEDATLIDPITGHLKLL